MTELDCFYELSSPIGIFGLFTKGIQKSGPRIEHGLIQLIHKLQEGIHKEILERARNIARRDLYLKLECQTDRISSVTQHFLNFGDTDYFECLEMLKEFKAEDIQ